MVCHDLFADYCTSRNTFAKLGVSNVSARYEWPRKGKLLELPKVFKAPELSGSSFERNVQLKQMGPTLWRKVDHKLIASWIVRDWGGIRGNNDKTIYDYVERIENNEFPSEYKGVATYSKILGLIDPDKWCIYDARVAVSLNCIQLLSSADPRSYFPYLASQNTKINPFKKAFPKLRLLKDGWQEIKPNDVYIRYNKLLQDLMIEHRIESTYLIEMALFIDCEDLISIVQERF